MAGIKESGKITGSALVDVRSPLQISEIRFTLQRSFVSVLENKCNAMNQSFTKNAINFEAVLHFKLLFWANQLKSFKPFIGVNSLTPCNNLGGRYEIILILCMGKMRQKKLINLSRPHRCEVLELKARESGCRV